MSARAIVQALAGVFEGVAGIKRVHTTSPEAMGEFPCVRFWLRRSELMRETAGMARGLYTYVAEVHLARGHLPLSDAEAQDLNDAIETALLSDPTLGGAVDAVTGLRLAYYGGRQWGSEVHLVLEYEVDVKVRRSVQ